jgi:hypothetical protein
MTNPIVEKALAPERCVIVVDMELAVGRAANAAAVIALTVGARHAALVGAPLIDASGHEHPGLIPIGIAVLAAKQEDLAVIRDKGILAGCDIIDFPIQGQQTNDYAAFQVAVADVPTPDLRYVGVALVGARKSISKIVANYGLLK